MAVFVVPGGEPLTPRRHTRLIDVLEAGLAGERRVEVVDVDRRLAARAHEIPEAQISEARGLLRSGEVLLRKGRTADALVRLETAERQLSESLSFVSKRELARAQYLVGAADAILGRPDAATAAFVRLQVWRPDYVADTGLAPGKVLPLWQAAQDQVEKRPGGSIELTSSPPGALAYVDGSGVGTTPTTVERLVVGRHYVTLKLVGYRRTVTDVAVSARTQRAITASLQPSTGYGQVRELLDAIRPTLGRSRASPALTRLGELLDIEHALIVSLPEQPGDQYRALLYDTRSRERLASASVAAGEESDSERALGELVGSLYAGLVLTPPPPAEPRRPARRKTPLTRRWWLWAGVAAVATAVAVPLLWSAGGDSGPSCPAGSQCGQVVLDF